MGHALWGGTKTFTQSSGILAEIEIFGWGNLILSDCLMNCSDRMPWLLFQVIIAVTTVWGQMNTTATLIVKSARGEYLPLRSTYV